MPDPGGKLLNNHGLLNTRLGEQAVQKTRAMALELVAWADSQGLSLADRHILELAMIHDLNSAFAEDRLRRGLERRRVNQSLSRNPVEEDIV